MAVRICCASMNESRLIFRYRLVQAIKTQNSFRCPCSRRFWAARPWSYLVSAIKLIWRGAPQNKDRGARPWSYLVSAIKLIWRGAPQNKDRGSEATEGVFCLRTKKPFHGTVRTGFFYFIVCLIAYSSRIFAPLTARPVRN